ncbi:ATP-binding protein [Argonema antarcticum]|uniref:ATP-binding protein n=1 Tax=Argonema antarcticum TaxID=2942763 RepID=UPI0020131ACB|nr:ATP-binding protein [Argonema antarcticum]MCL1471052.1 ATP-binding protein [Argonema antarcticum A004/B2]
MSIRASIKGLETVDKLRKKKNWRKDASKWADDANTSPATLKRFWRRLPIQESAFIAICKGVGLENWEEIVDKSPVQQKLQISPYLDRENRWVARSQLITQLSAKLQGACRVLILTGITGIGKTALAERLAVELQRDYPDFFRVNFDERENADFASVAAQLLTSWGENPTPEDRKEVQRLLNWVVSHLRQNRYLLAIDSLELILEGDAETGWSNFKDEWWEKFFQSLLSANSCQSRIVLTSQDLPGQLEVMGLRYSNFWHCQSLSGFTEAEQLEFFHKNGLDVSAESPAKTYLERIGVAYEGHPLALRAIAGEIVNHPFNSNVVAYWKQYGHEIEEVEQSKQQAEIESADDCLKLDRYTRSLQRAVQQRIEKTFERLAKDVPNAYLLLCFGSVYRRAVPESFYLKTLERFGLDEDPQQIALDALRDRYLIEEDVINDDLLLRQHNLIRCVALVHLQNWKTRGQI